MRKALIAIISLLLAGAGVWGVAKSQRKYTYPYPKVAAEIASIASTSGASLVEERTVSAHLRAQASRVGFLDSLLRNISGKPLVDDLEEYTLQDGPDTVRVSVYHSLGKVGQVEIRPTKSPSKPAAALVSGLATSFPKLDCHVEKP